MSPFTGTSPHVCQGSVFLLTPFPHIRIPWSSVQSHLLCARAICTHHFHPDRVHLLVLASSYLSLPSLFFPVFLPHTLSYPCISFLMLVSHAVPSFSPVIICLENKSCTMSTSQHRKELTHSPRLFPLCFSHFLPKLFATYIGMFPDLLKFGSVSKKLLRQKCFHCFT